jgi:hypothetical protein
MLTTTCTLKRVDDQLRVFFIVANTQLESTTVFFSDQKETLQVQTDQSAIRAHLSGSHEHTQLARVHVANMSAYEDPDELDAMSEDKEHVFQPPSLAAQQPAAPPPAAARPRPPPATRQPNADLAGVPDCPAKRALLKNRALQAKLTAMQTELNTALLSNLQQREQLRRSIEAQCVNWTQDPEVLKRQTAIRKWFDTDEFKRLAAKALEKANEATFKQVPWKANSRVDRIQVLKDTVKAKYPDATAEDVDKIDWEAIAKTEGIVYADGEICHGPIDCRYIHHMLHIYTLYYTIARLSCEARVTVCRYVSVTVYCDSDSK